MVENMPSKIKDKIPANAPIDFDKVEVGKSYTMKMEHPDTGKMEKKEVKVTGKRENETTDGTPGGKILSYQFKGF